MLSNDQERINSYRHIPQFRGRHLERCFPCQSTSKKVFEVIIINDVNLSEVGGGGGGVL